MSDTLYLQLDQNIEVTNPHVYLQDIAALSMADAKKLNRLRVMQVMVLDPMKPGRYVMSVSDLLKMILKVDLPLIFLPSEKRILSSPTDQLFHRHDISLC